ncbi:hypothetical protein LSP04_14220 [Levilactobacillus spicheri]|uniref:Transposase n=1 Tax=Levilactobacillus spicheri TaxID=216463 RepID=A0ABQ0WPP3_9LACO|nr:hypothetical protein [Levilactobacillus spicheri]GEO67003.1 hypothetical protein LSP04_14220 [Levilactobacillus spicheri]
MAAANHDFKQVVYVHNRRELARLLNVLVPEKRIADKRFKAANQSGGRGL